MEADGLPEILSWAWGWTKPSRRTEALAVVTATAAMTTKATSSSSISQTLPWCLGRMRGSLQGLRRLWLRRQQQRQQQQQQQHCWPSLLKTRRKRRKAQKQLWSQDKEIEKD
jgi:hypothetical protein